MFNLTSSRIVIAIDGPAGAGKSTIAKLVAEKINYIYIDTGAMYRAVTLKLLETGESFSEALVGDIAKKINISFNLQDGKKQVLIDGVDVSEKIRSHEVTASVSKVAAVGAVRTAMVEQQRQIGSAGGVVMDGRDIGTVVFPRAELKIFLTATVEERARRRYEELVAKGSKVDLTTLQSEIALRDKLDTERELSPLSCAEDAIYLDSSDLDIMAVVNKILEFYQERCSK